ncbi:hypothetical protein acdb102_08210 [Acidothermaceae bacterium B102]|nr:hypothetical protein acdb102_08210 [Acidothermaceae bacterium B102]
MTQPPAEVTALAQRRADARTAKDFAASDSLRDEIAAAGWVVRDTPDGFTLNPKPPYDVLASVGDLPDHSADPDQRLATVSVLVEGWPDDVRTCLVALAAHLPAGVVVVALDLGNVDGAGDVLHELATAHPGVIEELHVERPAGWAAARTALLKADVATVHVLLDPSTVLEGDALSPVLAAFDDASVAGAGWRGVNVDVDDQWRSFTDAGQASGGEVDAILGYLFAVRRSAGLAVGGPHPKARFYRNADMEFSLALREAGGRLVVPEGPLPVRQDRHRGYHDSDPAYRDAESAKTYNRLLQRFRGRKEILAPRG